MGDPVPAPSIEEIGNCVEFILYSKYYDITKCISKDTRPLDHFFLLLVCYSMYCTLHPVLIKLEMQQSA